jgi:hypothetical protein
MTRLRQRMLDDLRRRNYAPDTIRSYIRAVQQFAEYFGRSPEHLDAEHVRRYQIHLLHEKKLAPGSVENCVSALRFLYKRTLKRRDLAFDDLPFPKQPRSLPTAFGGPEHVLQYLARYTHRVAISNHRLVAVSDTAVSFRWKDYAHTSRQRTMTIAPDEFLRRFLQHVLPRGFPRIRYFGWLANRCRRDLLPLCRTLLNQLPPTSNMSSADELPVRLCPRCKGSMYVVERLTAVQIYFMQTAEVRLDSS